MKRIKTRPFSPETKPIEGLFKGLSDFLMKVLK